MTSSTFRIGADVGGTFTDIILLDDDGNVYTHKLLSTPPHFEQAVLNAIGQLQRQVAVGAGAGLGLAPTASANHRPIVGAVAHGTTVATNAVLEHRGARTALITTQGFRDVLELRRIRAPQMYDLFWDKPVPLVERYLRLEISERMSAQGEVLKPIEESELWQIKAKLEKEQVESVAVCLLHAYAFPQHELHIGAFLQRELPQLQVSLSHEVLRERKEYERTATTVVNAYVRPIMQRYLAEMRRGLGDMQLGANGAAPPLLIMQSAGGLTPADEAAVRPVYVLESGPAAGVIAAAHIAARMNIGNAITLDIGGTTAKAAMIEEGRIAHSPEYEVGASLSAGNRLVGGGGELIRAPTIDIAEVGAGGGSIAFLDRAGGLRVGPRSAGAAPGPACYQRGGTAPTVTDANVVLGYIRAGKLADGSISIDRAAAERAIYDQIAKPLGLSLLHAAEGIHRIANARTMRALRAVSTERGRDPRDFALIAFGGSGPIHAAGLAHELAIQRIIIPPLPGLFSALGLLFTGIVHHDARSCLLSGDALSAAALQRLADEMRAQMLAQFKQEGFSAAQITFTYEVDVRFKGQASEIRILLEVISGADESELQSESFTESSLLAMRMGFESEHKRLYGHGSDPDNPIEVVAMRLEGRVPLPNRSGRLNIISPQQASTEPTTHRTRAAYFGGKRGLSETPIVTRQMITETLHGPLLIDEYDSTTVVPPGFAICLDEQGSLVLSLEG